MRKECVKSGKTVEEAIAACLAELKVDRSQVQVEVLQEPSKGFMGLFSKPAQVKVIYIETPVNRAVSFLKSVCQKLGLNVEIEADVQGEYVTLNITGEDKEALGVLIGRRGDTLDALQYLVNLVANKQADDRQKFVLDVEGYRKRREQTLQRLALKMAEKVKRYGKEIALEPMSPQERRIIHTTLQNHKYVYTTSEGEEPYRKIVIFPKK
ncbi:RNA-binding cell elongation regulator Jag/EloR [Carboxydocella sp. JDF658]|uniref:RNA-binding cell elongation regulator Jag/EloR n=1 Tax=Carboxydocella sp. JDF658 TaxID=1926600 RepID=UPI0009AE04AA|nr:RNA-binding cell elongation regulator Jag/EloR [Carboxydocella sp. JDF658]AVX32304.1 spoIIIJ-associated protein [Carboxydocella thermautotrophica]GAW32242.1 DNA-binding protein [Carboxydocella sp. JDF658]